MSPLESVGVKADDVHALAARYHAANPRVIEVGEPPVDSIDVLVDPLPGATLFDLGGLQEALQDLLGVPVDVVTPGDLPPDLRARVLERARPF